MLDKYTVTLRGEAFTLYRDQIEFDAPNYFSDLFLGDFSESQTRTVELSRSPELFRAIVDYMSGYTILPLTPAVVPATMTSDSALKNLSRDAEFYGLRGLVALLRPPTSHRSTPTAEAIFDACQAFALGSPAVPFSSLLRGELPAGVISDQRGVGSVRGGTWRPVPIKASGIVVVHNGSYEALLSEPLLHETLSATFTQLGFAVPMTTYELDRNVFCAMQATLPPSANISVDGMDATGKLSEACHTAAGWTSPRHYSPVEDQQMEDLTLALKRNRNAEDIEKFVFVAQDIVFTIRPCAHNPPSMTEVCIIAARFVSRANAASCLL